MGEPAPDLPAEFRDRLRKILGDRSYAAALESFAVDRPTAFRVNALAEEPESLARELGKSGFTLTQVPWKHDAFSVPPEQRRALTETEACNQGRLYIQNPSSRLVPTVLDPHPEEEVLDLCAAPGSKTLQLAAIMRNRGRIAAVESVRGRFFKMRANLETAGVANVDTYLRDGSGVWKQCSEMFDRALVDAPCSSEGRFRSADPETFAGWNLKKIRQLQRKQTRLLNSAVRSLRPGGILVYSTCTFAPEENEVVIDGLLERFDRALEVEQVNLPCPGAQEGLTRWRDKPLNPEVSKAARIVPDELMEGFFICRMRKVGSTL